MSDLDPATDSRLADLAKQLPFDAPDDARRESVRASLFLAVRDEQAAPRRSWGLAGVGFVAGALAAAAIAVLVVRTPASSSTPAPIADHGAYATVESSNAVALEHVITPTATGTIETVRVRAGKLRLAVPAVRDGDRVQLATRDAQVEGAGAFDVEVVDDSLRSITVARGTARVVVEGQAPVFLATGQTWRAPIETDVLTPSVPSTNVTAANPTDVVALAPTNPSNPANIVAVAPVQADVAVTPPSPTVASRVAPPPTDVRAPKTVTAKEPTAPEATRTPEPARAPEVPPLTQPPVTANPPVADPSVDTEATDIVETHFQAGWKLLRAGKYAEAAKELGTAAAGEGPLAADALYFQAQALIKISRGTEAERALVAFLDRSPSSPRRGRAVVMLARLLAQRGDTGSARTWYESVADDKDPAVQAAAKHGLTELDK
jgi:TolA-binding protein